MSHIRKFVKSLTCILHAALGSRAANRAGILLYHRVHPTTPRLPDPAFNVTPDLFRSHLAGLLARGFRFVSLDDLLRARRAKTPLPPQSVVLTFDDGYQSLYEHAFPVLRELDVPAVVFLPTAYLDSRDPLPFDPWGLAFHDQAPPASYLCLRVEQCREMAASGLFTFGAHTHTHQDFRGRPDDLRADLQRSVGTIRALFGCDEVTFAFPYGKTRLGYAGGAMTEAARSAQVSCALTTDCALIDPQRDDPFAWGRFTCCSWDTPDSVAAKLAGWYSWAPQLQYAIDRILSYDRCREFKLDSWTKDAARSRRSRQSAVRS